MYFNLHLFNYSLCVFLKITSIVFVHNGVPVVVRSRGLLSLCGFRDQVQAGCQAPVPTESHHQLVCVCVCVCVRERERVCVYMCECVSIYV